MQAKIDPLTGGLVWESERDKKKQRQQLSEELVKRDLLVPGNINILYNPQPSRLSLEEKIQLIQKIGEEIIDLDGLKRVLQGVQFPICYDGFEPSGRMHIAQGLLRALNVNRLVDAGCIFIFWVADWFALLNNKMGGDLNKIKQVGRYFIEVWKAAGMKMHNVKFLWTSDEINKRPTEYWLRVLDIARKNTVNRVKRCGTIMGRTDDADDSIPVAQLFYPCMQCTDIFFLEADICQLGKDQRKVNMLAREYSDNVPGLFEKPIIVSHRKTLLFKCLIDMLYGLKEGQAKMSKSDPDSAIFMEDSAKDVERKIKQAFCPEGIVVESPILDYTKEIIFGLRKSVTIKRKPNYGGDVFEELEQDFKELKLHPGDLKPAVWTILNELIQPVRDHFEKNIEAKQLLQTIRSYQVTK